MAVKKEAYDVKVQIRFENGTNSYGKTAVKTMSLGQIKLGATDRSSWMQGPPWQVSPPCLWQGFGESIPVTS